MSQAHVRLDPRPRDPRATDRRGSPSAASPSPPERPERQPEHQTARLSRYLEKLAADDFYGKVIVSFQHGKICDVKIEQTKKLEEL
jgi:hypothetical protein